MGKDYGEGKIYSIHRLTEPDIILYTGSTTLDLDVRFDRHKGAYNSGKKYKLYNAIRDDPLGWDNYFIQLIEYHPCNNRDELVNHEGRVQRIINPTLNKNMAGRKRDELIQTDEYIEYFKTYKATHKAEQKAYMVKFYLNNPGYKKMKYTEYKLKQAEAMIL